MLEIIIENYKPIGKILLILITFIAIFGYIFLNQIREHMKNNWDNYKSHPLIMPFSGLINKEKGKSIIESTNDNFMNVLGSFVKSLFKLLSKPIYPIINIFTAILKSFQGTINKIRLQLNVIRGYLFKLFEKMLIKLQEAMSAVVYFFLKLRETLKRSFGIFALMINTAEHMQIFMESLFHQSGIAAKFGEIGGGIGWFFSIFTLGIPGQIVWSNILCFDPNTDILTKNGTTKIKNIKAGDILYNNSTVISKIIANNNAKEIYLLNNTRVTSDHIVYYINKWIRVKDHPDAKLTKNKSNQVICLITSDGTIRTKTDVFRDYLDNHNEIINNKVDMLIENYLNNTTKINNGLILKDKTSGIGYNIRIINDDIEGVVHIDTGCINLYKIDNCYLSEKIIILENGIWKRVPNHSRAEHIGYKNIKCINYITNSEKIYLENGLVIRDFTESRNDDLNSTIDHLVLNNLNDTLIN